MTARPGLAGQAFVETEPHPFAGGTEFIERAVIAVQELQLLAIRRRMPDLDHANEALLRGLRRRDRGAGTRRGPRESFALWSSIHGTPPSPEPPTRLATGSSKRPASVGGRAAMARSSAN